MSSVANVAKTIINRRGDREQEQFLANQIGVAEALQESAEPLSKRDLQYEAHLGEHQVRRALRLLRERDIVEQVDNPDDGRIPRYQLAQTGDDGESHDRGQITPVGAGVLMLVVGLLLLAGITIGVIA